MIRVIILILALTFSGAIWADEKPDLHAMYQELDQAIERLDDCLAERQEQINTLKEQYSKAREPMRRYLLAEDLFNAYRKLINDSALNYGNLCIKLANEMGRADLRAESYIRLAHQFGESGAYGEAQKYFQLVDNDQLVSDDVKAGSYKYSSVLLTYDEQVFYGFVHRLDMLNVVEFYQKCQYLMLLQIAVGCLPSHSKPLPESVYASR